MLNRPVRFAVDALFESGKSGTLAGQWCHLTCDDFSEEGIQQLHHFAQSIGLRHCWFQNPKGKIFQPHYDLRPSKRVLAIRAGAVEITGRELVGWMVRARAAVNRPGPLDELLKEALQDAE